MQSWHGPQAKPSLLWWGPSDTCGTFCSFADSTKAKLVTRITRSPNAVGRAFDTAYSTLRLWEQREKHDAYRFLLQAHNSARRVALRKSVRNDPKQDMDTILWHLHRKIVDAVRRGYFVQSPGQRHALVLFSP